MNIDLHTPCRTCLASAPVETYVPLFKSDSDSGNLAAKLTEVTSLIVAPYDGLPLRICSACLIELERSYAFKRKCESSHSTLQALMLGKQNPTTNENAILESNAIKVEAEDYVEQIDESCQQDSFLLSCVDVKIEDEPSECFYDGPSTSDSGAVQESTLNSSESTGEANSGTNKGKKTRRPKVSYTCETCGRDLKTKYRLQVHERTHTGEKPFVCTVCGMSFARKAYLKGHEFYHTGEKPFSCSICGKTFSHQGAWKRHESNVEAHAIKGLSEQSKLFYCVACDKGFATQELLQQHEAFHSRERPYICPVCEQGFYTRSALRSHEVVHWETNPFTCSICGKGFNRKVSLQVHETSHTAIKPFVCDICGKGFGSASLLTRHKHIHEGQKRFTCHCGAEFNRVALLKIHEEQCEHKQS